MAYSKLQKVIQDFALGYQTINQARDNADQLQTDLGVKHGRTGAISISPNSIGSLNWQGALTSKPWEAAGRHNDLLVPRGVARIDVALTNSQPVWWFQTQSPNIFPAAARLTTGVYIIATQHLSTDQWADISLESDGSTPRFADCRYYYPGGGYEGFLVKLYSLDAGAFTVDDYSFSLRVRSTNT